MPTERPVGQDTGSVPLIGNERILFNGGITPKEATLSEVAEYVQSRLTEVAPNDIIDWSPVKITENSNYQITTGTQYSNHLLSYTDLNALPTTDYIGNYIGYNAQISSLPAEVAIHIPPTGIAVVMLYGADQSPITLLQSQQDTVSNPIVSISKFGGDTQVSLFANGQTTYAPPDDIGGILTLSIDANNLLTIGGIPPNVFSVVIDTLQYSKLFIGSFAVITPTPTALNFTVATSVVAPLPLDTVDGALFRITNDGDYNGQSLRTDDYVRYIEETDSFIIWRLPIDRTDLALTIFINELIDSFLVRQSTINYIRSNASTEILVACSNVGPITAKILSEIAKMSDINHGYETHVDAFQLYMGSPNRPKILWRGLDSGTVNLHFTTGIPTPSQGVIYLLERPTSVRVESWGNVPLFVSGAPTTGGNIRLESGAIGTVYQVEVTLSGGRTALHWEKVSGALLLQVVTYDVPTYLSNVDS